MVTVAERAYNREYYREYSQRPEVKERLRANGHAYHQRSEVKARDKARNHSPERLAYMKAYNRTPKMKAYIRAYCTAYHLDRRIEMLALYGNACQRSGETRLDLLEQHHSKSRNKDGYPGYPPELQCGGNSLVNATLKWVEDHDGALPPDIELLSRPYHRIADKELAARLDEMMAVGGQ